eukprot:m.122802 g.122802  ORF g.122802 m.122802 type:complete len:125 (+) comp37799_c0_seq24:239-613(+)
MSVISKRGRSFIQPKNVIDKAFEKWKENSYDPRKNPTGIVNLGTSANGLMFDVIKAKALLLLSKKTSKRCFGLFRTRLPGPFRFLDPRATSIEGSGYALCDNAASRASESHYTITYTYWRAVFV